VVTQPGFRGCRYLGADLGFADIDHPIHQETSAYRQRVRAVIENELANLCHPSPRRAAEQLQLLVEGVLATGAASTVAHPGRVARALAEPVLDPDLIPITVPELRRTIRGTIVTEHKWSTNRRRRR